MMKWPGLLCLILLSFCGRLAAQCINTYPYSEDFEGSNGNWTPGGTNADWSWGSPVKSQINSAGSGLKCWISGGLAGAAYAGSQKSYIESPCFDLSSLQKPYLHFLIYWDTEKQYDGGNVQYSINGGITWVNLGNYNMAQDCLEKNWFNSSNITNLSGLASPQQGWSGTTQNTSGSCLGGNGSGSWKEAGICIGFLSGQTAVQFRFTFSSGSTCNAFDGIAVDLFRIEEAPVPQPVITSNCNGGYTVNFTGSSSLCPQSWRWNFGDPSTLGDSAITQNAQYTYNGPGTYTVTLESGHTCSAKGFTSFNLSFPVISVTVDPVNCEGGSDGAATAVATGVSAPVYTWGTDPVTTGADVNGLAAGTYSLNIASADGCTVDTLIEIPYGPDAEIKVDLGADHYVCAGETVLLYPGSYSDYLWQDGSSDSAFLAFEPGIYSVLVSNAAGCTATDETKLIYSCGDNVWIPTAFTPGEDGLNDRFKPEATVFEEGKLLIFNRWGQPVFNGDYMAGWDGNCNGEPSPQGIYYYRFRYRLPGDKFREKAGWLTLVR